jgi:hypothetical protein
MLQSQYKVSATVQAAVHVVERLNLVVGHPMLTTCAHKAVKHHGRGTPMVPCNSVQY